MIHVMDSREQSGAITDFREQCISAFRFMQRSRLLDEKLASLYRGGKIHGGVFLGKGQEAVSAATGVCLRKGDVFAPLIRDGAGRMAFGEPVIDVIRTYFGSVLGPMRGRDGNVHRGRLDQGILPMISHLGAMVSVVNGMLMARRFKQVPMGVGVASVGDGTTSTGSFHEAFNQAAIEKLPLVAVVANNQYAYSTPNERQFACRDLVDRAVGYGVTGYSLDGTDLASCLTIISRAIDQARNGGGPQLVVAQVLRLCGHGEHDDASYIGTRFKNSPVGRDCLDVAEAYLIREGLADAAAIAQWRQETIQEIEEAVSQVQQEPAPNPYKEDWCAISNRNLSGVLPTPKNGAA